MPDPKQSFLLMAQAGGILALACLPILLWWRVRKEPLLPQPGKWAISWSGWGVLAAFGALIIVPGLIQMLLDSTGFYRAIYGADFPSGLEANKLEHQQAAHLRMLWSQTLAAPVIVALLVIGFRYGFNAAASEMGISRNRLVAKLALGFLGWLVIAPLSFFAFALAILLFPNPDKHPLMDLGTRAGRLEMAVFALQVTMLWPMVEELVFRGILLAWLVQEPKSGREAILQPQHRSHVCVCAAMVFALQTPTLSAAIQANRWNDILPNLGPVLFIVALLPVYLFLPFSRWLQRRTGFASPQANQALIASSILFASVHSSIWPTPIPLFVLGFGLGWLALRTRSIVPSTVVHALFNGIAVVYQRLEGIG